MTPSRPGDSVPLPARPRKRSQPRNPARLSTRSVEASVQTRTRDGTHSQCRSRHSQIGSHRYLTEPNRYGYVMHYSALSGARWMPMSREICQQCGCGMSLAGTYILHLAILPFLDQL